MTCYAIIHQTSESSCHSNLLCHGNKSDTGHTPLRATIEEKYRENFCQSIQICYREKEKLENNDNCKAFCVTRKRSK